MALTVRYAALAGWLLCAAVGGPAAAEDRDPPILEGQPQGVRYAVSPPWSSDPRDPGFELPETGRSLFDHLVARAPDGRVPFPLSALVAHIEAQLEPHRYFDSPVVRVLVPRGRSLQREAAAPRYFHYPRAVLAVDAGPSADSHDGGMLLRHRLYIGYMEVSDILEVVSYNEASARFEFQLVRDYTRAGARRVVYANRTLCTACHQNAAPIFARPLWDETNANPKVSDTLASEERTYYGFPVSIGVDVAYAFDNATDEANLYSALQRIWQEACGEGQAGDDCRGGLLETVLRYGLSGARGIARDADFEDGFLAGFTRGWYEAFPKGLAIPDPDVPNRSPNTATAGPVPVSGGIDALRLRAPRENWRLDDDAHDLVAMVVSGLSGFLADSDFDAIDEVLSDARPERDLGAQCTARRSAANRERLRLRCAGAFDLSARVRLDGDLATGSVARLVFDAETFLDLRLTGRVTGVGRQRRIEFGLSASDSGRRPRTLAGDGLAGLTVHWPEGDGEGDARLSLDAGGARLALAVAALRQRAEAGDTDVLSDQPFRRVAVMSSLEAALDMTPRSWCCLSDDHLPPIDADHYVEAADEVGVIGVPDVALSLFLSYCGSCHRTRDPFPPNFLAGNLDEINRRLAHCSERLFFRLSMWQRPPGAGPRSPMPPHQFIYRTGLDPQEWVQNEHYRQLHAWIVGQLAEQNGAGFNAEGLLTQDYQTLRACLPADLADGHVAARAR